MKNSLIFLLVPLFLITSSLHAQLEKVIVETYYISDANDATDTIDGAANALEDGSKTYRVYIDLKPGYKLKKIYGDVNHALKISSTASFFNNIDQSSAYFGYSINKAWFNNNPTIALDSWITLGFATKTQLGVLKTEDTDVSSFIGGANNSGGTAAIAAGLLSNTDPLAGIPLITSDGLMISPNPLTQFDFGFRDLSGTDTTIFGTLKSGSSFSSNNAFIQQNSGVMGVSPDSNKILVAQLTTKGELSFELNVEVLDSLGNVIKFVANDSVIVAGETLSPFLSYPPSCGCLDPNFLEYSSSYACNNPSACVTRVVLGCMDTLACNYDPKANMNVIYLCCYPGYCNDRDISLVCPAISNSIEFSVYPNPAQDHVYLQVSNNNSEQIKYSVFDSFGVKKIDKNLGNLSGIINELIDISTLNNGLYLLRVDVGSISETKMFMKN